jgi:predicted porin
MKKLLIATAALAMVAGTAQAQSSVTVYGNLDVNYGSVKTDGADKTSTTQGQSAISTSRLGFKGTEDLGGGLKAEFQLEGTLSPTTGQFGANAGAATGAGKPTDASAKVNAAATTFNREAWVGFSSAKLGSVRVGRTDLTSAQGFDSTVGQVGDLSNTRSGDLGQDVAKVIRYTTPTWNGLTAEVGYSNESSQLAAATATTDANTTGEVTAGRLTSATIKYEAGKLGLYAGQTTRKVSATEDQDDTFLGATYDFGIAKVGVAYRDRDGVATSASSGAVTGLDATKDLKQTIYSVSAPVSMLGAGVKAHVAYHVSESATEAATDSKKTTVALTKGFSKRTTGYVAVIDENFNLTGKDTSSYVIGVNHAF